MNVREVVAEWRRGCSCDGHLENEIGVDAEPAYPGRCSECTDAAMRAIVSAADRIQSAMTRLQAEVERYLSRPGCNASSRATAFGRLTWALDQSRSGTDPGPDGSGQG